MASPEKNKYTRGRSGGINTEDAGKLKIWIGCVDGVSGEDGRSWAGM